MELLDFLFQILVFFPPQKTQWFCNIKCPNFLYIVKFCIKEECWYHIVPGYYKTNIYLRGTNYSKLETSKSFCLPTREDIIYTKKNRATIRYFEDYKVKMTLHGDHWRALLGTCWVLWGSDGCDFNTFWTSLKLVVGACTYGSFTNGIGVKQLASIHNVHVVHVCWVNKGKWI